jgi:hypothetical protein
MKMPQIELDRIMCQEELDALCKVCACDLRCYECALHSEMNYEQHLEETKDENRD